MLSLSTRLTVVGAVGLGVGAEDAAPAGDLDLGGVDVARVPGVGEPDAALGVHGQVVGSVEGMPFDVVGGNGGGAVGVEAHDGPPAGAAAEETPGGVMGQAVGAVGALAPDGNLVGLRVYPHDAAGRDVGKQQLLAVPDGPLGDAPHGLAQQLKFPTHNRTPALIYGLKEAGKRRDFSTRQTVDGQSAGLH